MRPLPTLADESPVIDSVPIASRAPGAEALAQGFTEAGNEAFKIGTDLADEQSSAMYMQTRAMQAQVTNQAKIKMIQNPGQAQQIADSTQQTLDNINTHAIVNQANRNELKYDTVQQKDEINLQAADTAHEQANRMGAFNFYQSLDENAKNYQNAVQSGDMKTAESIQTNTTNVMRGLVATGGSSPREAGHVFNVFHGLTDRAQMLHDVYQSGQVNTAQQYNTLHATSISNDPTQNAQLPSNETTNFLMGLHRQENTAAGVASSMYTHGEFPSMQQLAQLAPKDLAKIPLQWQGVATGKGLVLGNEPFNAVQSTLDTLNKKDASSLTISDTATKNYLSNWVDNIKQGNWLQVSSDTAIGSKIKDDYIAQDAAIKGNGALSPQDKMDALNKNLNNFVSNSTGLAQSMHIPNQYIQPIPMPIVGEGQGSFARGADPTPVIQLTKYFDPTNRSYFAGAMKTPAQREVVQAIAYDLQSNNADSTWHANIVRDNQEGNDWSALNLGKDGKSEAFLRSAISANPTIQSILGFKGRFANGNDQQQGLVTGLLNNVRGDALRANDPTLSNYPTYINNIAQQMARCYPLLSGANYQFNSNQVHFSKPQADMVAQYMLGQGHAKISDYIASRTNNPLNTNYFLDRRPMVVTLSPDNNLQLNTPEGQTIYHEPFTPMTLARAAVEGGVGGKKNNIDQAEYAIESRVKANISAGAGIAAGIPAALGAEIP